MRIAFLGKGGSGKTSLAAGYSRWLEHKNRIILAIDADVNTHLQDALNLDGDSALLGSRYEEIASYVRGARTDLGDRPILSSTPPSPQSQFIECRNNDPLLERYILKRGSLFFLKIGAFSESDVGANCYHTKLHSLCVLLNHLNDSTADRVVIDATAGIDTLSTSLVVSYDLNIFVVEPTLKSIEVYLDYIQTDSESAKKTLVVINKIASPQDQHFVSKYIPDSKIVAVASQSLSLRAFEQGDKQAFENFVIENKSCWEKIEVVLQEQLMSREDQFRRLHEIHKKNCEWWYNSYYGRDLHTGLDAFDKEL